MKLQLPVAVMILFHIREELYFQQGKFWNRIRRNKKRKFFLIVRKKVPHLFAIQFEKQKNFSSCQSGTQSGFIF